MRGRVVALAALACSCSAGRFARVALPRAPLHAVRLSAAVEPTVELYGLPEEGAWLQEGITAIRAHNAEVLPLLEDLRGRRFFRLYAADLLASCSYMPTEEVPCELGECEVDAMEDVPSELSARDESESDFELDGWARWDQPSDFTEYYDLIENPEGNTGYDGSNVWRFIHQKICFQKEVSKSGNEWKGDFNRAVSGLHSSVSAHIIADMATEDEAKALDEYRRRLRDEPDAVVNLHFALMIVLCGVDAARERLDGCGYLGEGVELLPTMTKLTASPLLTEPAVQRAAYYLKEHTTSPSAEPWKLRLRTRDLLRLMNCVQCNICRLHGKVMVLGFAAALQVLLGISGRGEESCNRPPDPTSLHRVEVAAMLTTCAKLASACEIVERFEALDAAGSSSA